MPTTTVNGYTTVPLGLPMLFGIYRRNVAHPEMKVVNSTIRNQVQFAMVRFLHFRQKSKMALLLNLMSLILLASCLWITQSAYILGLGVICYCGFLILFAKARGEKDACFELLDKSSPQSAKYLVVEALVYPWAYFRQDRQMRSLMTSLFRESGFLSTR